jgi:acyl-CoA synthetase (AMP-forming)/AMP-acid ligase II
MSVLEIASFARRCRTVARSGLGGHRAILDDRRPTPDTTFETIERFRPTLYYGVPALYAAQLVALDKGKRDLSSLRACVSAGEALPAEIFRRWKETTGLTILDGIGSTEALHIFIGNRLDDFRPSNSGKPVPGYEVKIVDEHGKPVPRGEGGRLWIRSESAAKYYWNKPEKTAETMVDGWLNTGDTYRQDEDGYFIYDGRSDDMLKVGGIWVSPVEVESALKVPTLARQERSLSRATAFIREITWFEASKEYSLDEFIETFYNTRKRVQELLEGMTDAQVIFASPAHSLWSVSESVTHLIYTQGYYINKLLDITTSSLPHIIEAARGFGEGASVGTHLG